MNRPYTMRKLAVLTLTLLFAVTGMPAEEAAVEQSLPRLSGLSGYVVDTEGNAVAGFKFAIQPMRMHENSLEPVDKFLPHYPSFAEQPEDIDLSSMPRTASKGQTDSAGVFTVTDIPPGLVQLSVLPDIPLDVLEMFDPGKPHELMRLGRCEPDKKILSIQIGKVTFFNMEDPGFFEGLTFALNPGVTIENVKVTVKPRLRIRARIVYADGTPLANAQADVTMKQRHEFRPNHGGTYGTDCFTDADGYFIQYMDEPGYYTLSVEYNNLSAGTGPFLLKDDVQPEEIVLMLEGKPIAVEPPPDSIEAPGNIRFREIEAPGNIRFHEIEAPGNIRFREPVGQAQGTASTKSVWVINPENGHAYKKIQCKDWHDAHRQAIEEDAHLVAINDEAEQQWLEVVFTHKPFWIGLTDMEKEGEWRWDSGEPVTYTNWVTHEMHPDMLTDSEKDYVVVTFRHGEWQSVGPESPFWRMARQAILEKDGLVSTIPAAPMSEDR